MTSRQPQIIRKEMCYAGNNDAQSYMYAGVRVGNEIARTVVELSFVSEASTSAVPFRPHA